MAERDNKKQLVENYRKLFLKHGDTPEGVQWSLDGQLFRFRRLAEVGDLRNASILEIGCGLGHFYPFLKERFGNLTFTGLDLVPETVEFASRKYPEAKFVCRDILMEGWSGIHDYCLISGVFNNAMPGEDATAFMLRMIDAAFLCCRKGMAFNFISTHVSQVEAEIAYHDPLVVMDHCIRRLTKKITISHHYERCDVSVFLYRQG